MDWWERCERRNIFASGGVGIGGFNVGIGGDGVDGDDRSLFIVYSFFVFLLSLNFLKSFKWVFFNNNNNRIVNGTSIGLIVYRYDKMAAAV